MAVADRVIVELEAKIDRYNADLRNAERRFKEATDRIAADSRRMEREIRANSTSAGAAIRGLAATFAAGFSLAQIQQLADGYTRFTNQLIVAGLEGEQLASTQDRLFAIAQKYGVELESLGGLYGRASQSAKELGASQAQLQQFTTGVAAALKIQGTSATVANGALTQLSQLLGSSRVLAEEFNSVNEGARPILQAVANNIDAAGGSVSRLKTLVTDGKISNVQFFEAFLKGSTALEAQAEKASLTIGNAFTVLNNALGQYIGQTDDSLSATERISAAIIILSENLDTVAHALGAIAAVMVGRYAAALAVGTVRAVGLRVAAFGLTAALQGTAAASAIAGRAMLAAFGGPVGLAVAALSLGIYYLATNTDAAVAAAERAARMDKVRADAARNAESAIRQLTAATEAERRATLASMEASRARAAQEVKTAQAILLRARAELAAARAKDSERAKTRRDLFVPTGDVGTDLANLGGTPRDTKRRAALAAAAKAEREASEKLEVAQVGLDSLSNVIDTFKPSAGGPAGGGDQKKKGGAGRSGPSGPSQSDIERRFNDELAALARQAISAEQQITTSATERAELALRSVELAHVRAAEGIKADKDYSAAQKARLLEQLEVLADLERQGIEFEKQTAIEQETRDLAAAKYDAERDALSTQLDLAKTHRDRRALELDLLELEYRYQAAMLDSVIASETTSEAEKERARVSRKMLDDIKGLRTERTVEATAGPLESYSRRLNRTPGELADAAEQLVVDELQHVQDGISKAITDRLGVKDPLIAGLLDLFIEQVIMRPLADAFANAQSGAGGGGGLLGSIVGGIASVFTGGPRASGGHVMAGRIYPINEKGIEGFQPSGSGKVIPLGRMPRAAGGGLQINQTVNVDARGVNPDGFADHIRAAVRQETTAIVAAGMRQVNAGVPSRLASYQRDGL